MSALDTVAEHLEMLDLQFRRTDDGDAILIVFDGDNIRYEAAIQARGRLISVIARSVSMVPRPRLDEAIRVANLLNATRVTFGSFWVDLGRARVAFEVTLAAPDGPTLDQVGLAMAALSQIDDWYPTLAAVIWGDKSAEAALFTASQHGSDPPALDLAV